MSIHKEQLLRYLYDIFKWQYVVKFELQLLRSYMELCTIVVVNSFLYGAIF